MNQVVQPVRVRFAPSPTGYLHIGGARTALYNYLLARQTGGQFILRIEDTDRERLVPDAEESLKDSLRWLGLDWDEGPDVGGPCAPYIQSERSAIHRQRAFELVERGQAYHCFCSKERLEILRTEQRILKQPPRYDGFCRHITLSDAQTRAAAGEPFVIRFKAPTTGQTVAHDLLRGDIRVDNSTLDDFILLKSDGFAVYHLAAMSDDHDMGITHVMRGEEWLPSMPRHALIIRAFGWREPVWCHLSLFNKPNGKGKLSKRDSEQFLAGGHSILVKDLKRFGFLPAAVLNWVALMGWSLDDKTEFFQMADLIQHFSLARLVPSAAAVNFDKLDHFQGMHVRHLSPEQFVADTSPFFEAAGYLADPDFLLKLVPLLQERTLTLDDAVEMSGFFFRSHVTPARSDLIAPKLDAAQTALLLEIALERLRTLPNFDFTTTHDAMAELVVQSAVKPNQLFLPLRVAVTGQKVSPPLFETMEILGRTLTLKRLEAAITILQNE
jgi:glutamyl-tRNA synthetase